MAWKEHIDKSTGKTYYFDPDTGETTWKKPGESGDKKKKKKKKSKSADMDADEAESDPSNWATNADPKTGRTYYYNKVTKKTSWKKPACMPDDESDESDESDNDESEEEEESDGSSEEEEEEAKPKKNKSDKKEGDWVPTTDPKTGKTYWFHRKTKKSTWKDPYAKSKATSDSDDDSEEDDSDDHRRRGSESESDSDDEDKMTMTTTKRVNDDSDSDVSDGNDGNDDSGDESDAAVGAPELNDDSDDEEDDNGTYEFKFAKHRKGWFNRTFRVGQIHDDSTLLTYKKSLIKKALLKQNRDLDAEAIQAFKNVMSYMGDRKSSKKPIEHAKKMLGNLMMAPAGLRDEVYMQICKQTTRNPRVASTIRGWELMSYCLATFPPSKHLRNFLMDYIKKTVKEAKDEKVVELAGVCAARVPKIVKMGQRKQVPSRMELECLKDVKPVPIRVSLVNGTFKSFNVDPYTRVKEVQDQLVEKYNLTVTKPFGMYESAEANVERILDPNDRILDVQAAWENQPKETAVVVEDKTKKQARHKAETKVVMKKATPYNAFLYKAKLVLKTNNQELMSDPEAINLIYIQATHDVVTARYPVNEKDITVLAALQLQATFGDFKKDVHVLGWLAPKIEEFMPVMLLERKGKKSDRLEKDWEQKILTKYAKVSGFTSLEAKLNYLDYVQEWTFYGSTFFSVEQRQFKDYPSPLTLGINCEGVILMHPEKQTVLENYGFTDIVTWGHSDEKFIVVVGNIVQQRKLIFKTNEGKAMNHLIHDYVKFKVKNKK